MADDTPIIVSPDGSPITVHSDRASRSRAVTKGLRQWFLSFSDFLKTQAVRLHCGLCHVDLPQTAEAWRHWGECSGKRRDETSGLIKPVMKTPTGMEWATTKVKERVELRAGQMEYFRQFQDVATYLDLGMHCTKCSTDVTGLNSDVDQVYGCLCDCRSWVGLNRDYTAPTPPVIH